MERGKWVYDEKSVMANGNLPINWEKGQQKALMENYSITKKKV